MNVLNRPLFSFIHDATTRLIYRYLLHRARAGHQVEFSLRCDSPTERRLFQRALTADAHLAARSLATMGAAQYPDDAELQKATRILAPPKLLRRLPAEPEKWANHEWLRGNRTDYRGRWVGLRNGELLATADSFRELIKQIPVTPDILFTKVM